MEETLAQKPSTCIRIVLFGPESTGKTTLAQQLAEHYNTVWVEEYMREYLQVKWNQEKEVCKPEDLLPIARGQMAKENSYLEKANEVLICDTNLLELKVYSEVYYDGYCEPTIDKYAIENFYDLYFLTYIDTPWTPDDLRDKPNDRQNMFTIFERSLQQHKKPYVVLKGDQDERLKSAISNIDKLLN